VGGLVKAAENGEEKKGKGENPDGSVLACQHDIGIFINDPVSGSRPGSQNRKSGVIFGKTFPYLEPVSSFTEFRRKAFG
tara:strand:- start:104 stop:340 length:237 start_codon:yes stop_codon:yes gene_type:complete